MGSNRNNSQSDSNTPRRDDPELAVLERVQELTWALLDDVISDDEVSLLDTLLLTGESARTRYIECVQLHSDLMGHFAKPSELASKSDEKSQVLSFLNAGISSVEARAPRPVE